MEFLEKVLTTLSAKMVEPKTIGWFHLVFIGIILVSTILICIFGKNWKWKKVKWVIFGFWIIMVLFEAYKQLIFSYDPSTGAWDYEWYAFPFQLCSTPLYILPIFIFSKSENVRESCAAFLMTFSLFGGLVTIVYPEQVLIETIGINIQTMVHHGLQVLIGVFLATYYRKKLNFKFFLKGVVVFAILFAVALALNFIVPEFINESFNMFYISLYEPCTLPLLAEFIYPNVPWPVFLVIYFVGFIIIGLIFFLIEWLCSIKSRKNLKPSKEENIVISNEEFRFEEPEVKKCQSKEEKENQNGK